MSNTLTKDTNISGTPAIPGTPGSPAIPAYYTTELVVTPGGTGIIWGLLNPNYPLTEPNYWPVDPGYIGAIPVGVFEYPPTSTYVQVFHPAVPATAPTEGTPASAALDLNLGWNAGARSITYFDADGGYEFSVPSTVLGVVVGLKTGATSYNPFAIELGLYFRGGLVSVQESGVSKTGTASYATGDVFTIERAGPIRYLKNDVVFYQGPITYGRVFLDSAMYGGGDSVVDASLITAYANVNVEMLPMATLCGIPSCSVNVAFPEMTVSVGVTTDVGARVSMLPMAVLSSDHEYGAASVAMAPMTVVTYGGAPAPAITVSSGHMATMIGASHGLTGEITVGDTMSVLRPLIGMSSDKVYGTATVEFEYMTTFIPYVAPITSWAFLEGPRGVLTASGTQRTSSGFEGVHVGGALRAFSGAVFDKAAPAGTLTASGTVMPMGRAEMVAAPRGILTASGVTGATASAVLTHRPRQQFLGYGGGVISIRVAGRHIITASGTMGGVGSATMRMPLCYLTASGTQETFGTAVLTGPALRPAVGGGAYLVHPGHRLVAYGTAVVSVTYEAYAVNLLNGVDRNPQNAYDPVVSEVTHYTNYPFNQIVRYNGAYYGVASTGLYLLEGDTDDGDPIAWSFRTALTDAGSKQFKRVRSLYVGGRLVSQATVTLVVGEEQDLTYSYTTPRGDNAQNYRVMFGKGVRTRYLAVEMADADGNFIEIDSLDLENEVLERAI